MFSKLLLLSFAAATLADLKCADSYAGYPCCKAKMDDKVSDSSIKSCAEAQAALFKDGKNCPDPNFKPPNDLGNLSWPASTPGKFNLIVFRAAKLEGNVYATKLENCNAADRAGVLSYIHSEVVPEDMRFKEDIDANRRKFGIDNIIIFNVTIMNPTPWLTPQIPLSPYVAFDAGKCLDTDPNCKKYSTDGYQVGYQVQEGNNRATYSADTNSNYWYSFPEGGLCKDPNGNKTCTYSYEVLGRINLDELVQLDRIGFKNYFDFAKAKNASNPGQLNFEFDRAGRERPDCCETAHGIDFWQAPCDIKQSYGRIALLMDATVRPINDSKFYNNTKDCGSSGGSGLSAGEYVAIIAGSIVVIGIVVYVGVYMMKSKKKEESQPLIP